MKDSGQREGFSTGAVRDQRAGKGRFDLIPPEIERKLALVLEAGAVKYGDRNWEKGIPLARSYDSLRRRLGQWFAGEDDEDHLGHACANLAFIVATEDRANRGLLPASLLDAGPLKRKAEEAQPVPSAPVAEVRRAEGQLHESLATPREVFFYAQAAYAEGERVQLGPDRLGTVTICQLSCAPANGWYVRARPDPEPAPAAPVEAGDLLTAGGEAGRAQAALTKAALNYYKFGGYRA